MFDIDIVKDMQDYYELYFKVTSHHKNRRKNDMQPEFSYAHWLKEATKSEYLKVDPKRYKHEIIRDGPIAYISYSNDMKKNIPLLEKELRNHNQNRKHTKVPHFSECMPHAGNYLSQKNLGDLFYGDCLSFSFFV